MLSSGVKHLVQLSCRYACELFDTAVFLIEAGHSHITVFILCCKCMSLLLLSDMLA